MADDAGNIDNRSQSAMTDCAKSVLGCISWTKWAMIANVDYDGSEVEATKLDSRTTNTFVECEVQPGDIVQLGNHHHQSHPRMSL